MLALRHIRKTMNTVLPRFISGNYSVSTQEEETMLQFARNFNQDCSDLFSLEIEMALEVVYWLSKYQAEGRIEKILSAFYDEFIEAIGCTPQQSENKIADFLYNEDTGLFARLENGDENVSSEDLDAIIDFGEHMSNLLQIEDAGYHLEDVCLAMDIMIRLPLYDEAWVAETICAFFETAAGGYKQLLDERYRESQYRLAITAFSDNNAFWGFRDGCYGVPDGTEEVLRDFAADFNTALRSQCLGTKDAGAAISLVHFLHFYAHEPWIKDLVYELVDTMLSGFKCQTDETSTDFVRVMYGDDGIIERLRKGNVKIASSEKDICTSFGSEIKESLHRNAPIPSHVSLVLTTIRDLTPFEWCKTQGISPSILLDHFICSVIIGVHWLDEEKA